MIKMHLLNHFSANLIGLLFVFMLWTDCVRSGRVPVPVTINKCCRLGEGMDPNRQCNIGGTEMWVPHVYLLNKKTYFMPKGEAPRFFKIKEGTKPATCNDPELFVGSTDFVLFSNGSLFISEKAQLVSGDDYCVEKDMALVCFPRPEGANSLTAPIKLTKVKKCCGVQSVYHEELANCIVLEDGHDVLSKKLINSSAVDIVYGFPKCESNHRYTVAGKFQTNYFDESDGSVTSETGRKFPYSEYCLEHTLNDIDSNVDIFTCAEQFSGPETVPVKTYDVRFVLYAIGLLISVIFLTATLVTGFLLPSNHHVLHWRCQTYYVACLLVGDLLLAITQIFGNTIVGTACVSMAVGIHFFFLAAFFWLNTMCFNIWWTFRDFRPTSLEKGQELVRLRIYQVYAWGVPFIICLVAIVLDNLPKSPEDTFLRPRFGEKKCFFYGDIEMLTYFYGPIGVLLCVNFLLFASTARQLTCGLWKRDDVKSTTERFKSLISRAALGRVCLKLIVVMGITWVADVLSWAVGGPDYFWYVTDLINALQGVPIFIVVGCQPQVWTAVKRLWSSRTGRGVMDTTNNVGHSSSSHGLPSIGESVTNNTFSNTTSSKIPMETIC
ncbi:probable G-protein coupled receptor Mth-like 1 isoform X2 [Bradysia coprophila]|uniref:probable G-protein coupled receptor Mth-like 1 isoform X2 n=1 Tax=Bradysia coprophila TaxID=38358 RepID=UPI00187DAD55|nr:probable G-protein coupled receptor Mth-like 1 isoform X2 [Bradysia coprophila]